jgi:hypothetical protein
MGGVAAGVVAAGDGAAAPGSWERFEPQGSDARREELMAGWHAAVAEAVEREEAGVA